jgi:putative flippase GtrA
VTAPAFARFPFSRQLATFLAVGIASAALDVGLLAGLLRLGVAYEIATTVAFFVALAFNYFSHAQVTFRARRTLRSMARYATLVVFNYGLTLVMVTLSHAWLDGVMAGKIASLPLVAIVGFVGGRHWVFRQG